MAAKRGVDWFWVASTFMALWFALVLWNEGFERMDEGDLDATLVDLGKWFEVYGGQVETDKVALGKQLGAGRGLIARKDLGKDTVLARIPLNCLASVEHAARELERYASSQELEKLSDLDLLAALVLLEKRKGENSWWLPLWESFPGNISSSPLFYCENRLANLRKLEVGLGDDIDSVQKIVAAHHDTLLQLVPALRGVSVEQFKTAIALVQSRVFSVPIKDRSGKWHKSSCLVPFADLLNTCEKQGLNADCRTNQASTHFECFATKDIPKGGYLCAPYTASGNQVLFTNYGFALEPAPGSDNYESERLIYEAFLSSMAIPC